MAQTDELFNDEHAKKYDDQFKKLEPIRIALNLLTRVRLTKLPANAHVLCAGAGTGHELLYLAEAFPSWRFTAMEPSGAMLKVCREKAIASGVADRCEFLECYVPDLPVAKSFDAATSLLVSQFITDRTERVEFFQGIAKRLKPGGMLVTADLATEAAIDDSELFEYWLEAIEYTGVVDELLDGYASKLKEFVSLLSTNQIEDIIRAGGFNTPTRFFQAGCITAWFTQLKQNVS